MKKRGVLLPITSLPSPHGVGDFGRSAYAFIDELSDNDLKIWQILPLNPLSYGNSPYQPYSSFAGDEIYISLELLYEEGLLLEDELKDFNENEEIVEYEAVRAFKNILLKKAYNRFETNDDFEHFITSNDWLNGYALFRVFKDHNDQKEWTKWEDQYKYYNEKPSFSLLPFVKELQYQFFLQYYFIKQWNALLDYAHTHDIIIIGDMPIYVGLDSADVWLNQENFLLEEDGTPSFVAGVPPDYFSKYGQRWGNPIYDWEYMEKNNFLFWVNRVNYASSLYDYTRIDHFRAFDTYWEIPSDEATAIIGEWKEAPGYKLFDTLLKQKKELRILAEDLGELREEVYELRDHYHFKGMFVFQFHYQQDFDFKSVVVYSGTHDNDTLKGWINSLDEENLEDLEVFLIDYDEDSLVKKIIHYCFDLESEDIIIPMWDILELDTDSRFNVPGTIGNPNWQWKLKNFDLVHKALKTIKTWGNDE